MNQKPFQSISAATLCALLVSTSSLHAQPTLLFEDITEDLNDSASSDVKIQDPYLSQYENVSVAAFSSLIEDNQEAVVSYRTNEEDGWEDVVPIETGSFQSSFNPVAEFDGYGNLSFLWISEINFQDEQKSFLRYRALGEEPETIVLSPLPIETPTLIFEDGNPIVAWTEGEAGVFTVYMAELTDSDWIVTPLSDSLNSYDILPQALSTTPPGVFWYSLNQDGFSIKGYQKQEAGWEYFTPSLSNLPSDRLPYLFSLSGLEDPGAIWVEPLTDGEKLFYYDPRLIEDFAITALPSRSGFNQLDPDASSESSMAFVWVEDSLEKTELRIFANGQEFTTDAIEAPTQPRVIWKNENQLLVTVISDKSLGGSGSLFSIDVTLE